MNAHAHVVCVVGLCSVATPGFVLVRCDECNDIVCGTVVTRFTTRLRFWSAAVTIATVSWMVLVEDYGDQKHVFSDVSLVCPICMLMCV